MENVLEDQPGPPSPEDPIQNINIQDTHKMFGANQGLLQYKTGVGYLETKMRKKSYI